MACWTPSQLQLEQLMIGTSGDWAFSNPTISKRKSDRIYEQDVERPKATAKVIGDAVKGIRQYNGTTRVQPETPLSIVGGDVSERDVRTLDPGDVKAPGMILAKGISSWMLGSDVNSQRGPTLDHRSGRNNNGTVIG